MIKGCSRRMIVLKNTGSDLFDEAYFVLKPENRKGLASCEKDFITEANKIISKATCDSPNRQEKSKKQKPKMCFLIGFLCGIFLEGAIVSAILII